MGPTEYSAQIAHLFYKKGKHIPLSISALGLAGEAGEVTAVFEEYAVARLELTPEAFEAFEQQLTLELGDVLWYVAAILDTLGHDFGDLDDMVSTAEELPKLQEQLAAFGSSRLCAVMSMHAGHAADLIKKSEWHGKTLDADELMATLGNITVIVSRMAYEIEAHLGQVCQANVDKLKKRYPAGFVEGGGVR